MKRVAFVLLLAIVAVLAWMLLARSPGEGAPAPVAQAPAAAPGGSAAAAPVAEAGSATPEKATAAVPAVEPAKPVTTAKKRHRSAGTAAVGTSASTEFKEPLTPSVEPAQPDRSRGTTSTESDEPLTPSVGPAEPARSRGATSTESDEPLTPSVGPAEPARSRGARPLTGAITGTLRDEKGHPVAGIRVLAVAADGADACESMTGDDGVYLVSLLRPGRYTVFIGLESAMASRFGARGVTVPEGGVAQLDLSAPANGATVRVRAVAADGGSAPAQAILLAGPPAGPSAVGQLLASDAIRLPELGEPRLVLTHVPPGVYTVVVLRGPGRTPVAAASPLRVGDEREIAVDVRLPADDVPQS